MMYNEALWWLEMIFGSCILPWSPATSNEPWGGIYIAHTPQTSRWKKADKKFYHRLNRCSHFCHHRFNRWVQFPTSQRLLQSTDVINRCSVGLTGECSCWKTNSLDNCTDVHQYLASVHPVYRFCLSCCVQCTDVFKKPNVGSTGVTKTPRRAPSQCTDVCVFLSVGSTGDT